DYYCMTWYNNILVF
nr:immunoglobulin light chain junction region [Macaca mulatta]